MSEPKAHQFRLAFTHLATAEALRAICKHEGVQYEFGQGPGSRVFDLTGPEVNKLRRVVHQWNTAIVDIMRELDKQGLL